MRTLFPSKKLFTLFSNMQITRLNLIIYNSYNWASSPTLFYTDKIISSRDLTCSCVVRLYSCRVPTCCSLGALNWFTIGTYDGTELRLLEGSTEVTIHGKLECLFIGDWIGHLDVLDLGTNVGNEIGLYDGKVLGRTLGALVGI